MYWIAFVICVVIFSVAILLIISSDDMLPKYIRNHALLLFSVGLPAVIVVKNDPIDFLKYSKGFIFGLAVTFAVAAIASVLFPKPSMVARFRSSFAWGWVGMAGLMLLFVIVDLRASY